MALMPMEYDDSYYKAGDSISASDRTIYAGFVLTDKTEVRAYVPLPKNPVNRTATVSTTGDIYVYYYNAVETVTQANANLSVVNVSNNGILISIKKKDGTAFTPTVGGACANVLFRYGLAISFS